MGCQDKIEDQESLNVFIQSLFSDADRLNVSKIFFSKLFNSCVVFLPKKAGACNTLCISLLGILFFILDELIKTIASNSYTNGYNITSV